MHVLIIILLQYNVLTLLLFSFPYSHPSIHIRSGATDEGSGATERQVHQIMLHVLIVILLQYNVLTLLLFSFPYSHPSIHIRSSATDERSDATERQVHQVMFHVLIIIILLQYNMFYTVFF